MDRLNFDWAPVVPVTGNIQRPFEIKATFPDEFNIALGTRKFVITEDEYGDRPVFTLGDADILLQGQELTIPVPKTHGLDVGEYYGELRQDVDEDHPTSVMKFVIRINPTQAKDAA